MSIQHVRPCRPWAENGFCVIYAPTVGPESLFAGEAFGAVVVQGDTNTALRGAPAANMARLPLVHVEASFVLARP